MKYARKTLPTAGVKAIDGQNGMVEAYASVFNNIDYVGEVIRPGFFADTINEASTDASKSLPSVLWSHDVWQPPVGITTDAEEVLPYDSRLPASIQSLGGLRVVGQFDMQSEFSRSVFNKIVMGALRKYSIGYYVIEDKYNRETGVIELLKGDWIEWSPVNFAANDATLTVDAKGRGIETDEHVYTVRAPIEFVDGSFRRAEKRSDSNGLTYTVITGKLRATGDTSEATIRFDADAWSAADAKSLCDGNGNGKGMFVAATKQTQASTQSSSGGVGEQSIERLADHGARVVAQVSAYIARVEDVKGKRLAEGKAGRVLSEANRTILAGLLPDLTSVIDRVQKLLDDTAQDGEGAGKGSDPESVAKLRKMYADMNRIQTELLAEEYTEVAS